jgi:8-oxo-dGTP pyrophosphatase MutT (NUDIX family)
MASTTAAAASLSTAAAILDDEVALCETGNESDVFPEEALTYDTYNGVTIKLEEIYNGDETQSFDPVAFSNTLQQSLQTWKKEGRRGIWIHIPTSCSAAVPICTEMGFEFQFAKNGLLVMTQWLPEEQDSRLPHGPTHQCGVGVIVLHPITHEMLVVQEKTGPAAAKKLWKMPTGLTDPGEDIVDAAIREAKEETGLDVEFDRIMLVRQAHGGLFNQSDMFFVCLLRLAPKYEEDLKNGIEVPLHPQEEEIADIAWMKMEDFAGQESWQGSPLYEELNGTTIKVAKLIMQESKNKDDKGKRESKSGLIAKNLPIGWRPGSSTLYVSKY